MICLFNFVADCIFQRWLYNTYLYAFPLRWYWHLSTQRRGACFLSLNLDRLWLQWSDVMWLPRPMNKMQHNFRLVLLGDLPLESSHHAVRKLSRHKERPRAGLSAITPNETPVDSQPSTTRHVSEVLDDSSHQHLSNPSKEKQVILPC